MPIGKEYLKLKNKCMVNNCIKIYVCLVSLLF